MAATSTTQGSVSLLILILWLGLFHDLYCHGNYQWGFGSCVFTAIPELNNELMLTVSDQRVTYPSYMQEKKPSSCGHQRKRNHTQELTAPVIDGENNALAWPLFTHVPILNPDSDTAFGK